MSKKNVPPYIYCPKCGSKVNLREEKDQEVVERIREQGYADVARGICSCGVVLVLCYHPLPASPTFSLYFDVYPREAIAEILKSKPELAV
jgi:hypothetical protein